MLLSRTPAFVCAEQALFAMPIMTVVAGCLVVMARRAMQQMTTDYMGSAV